MVDTGSFLLKTTKPVTEVALVVNWTRHELRCRRHGFESRSGHQFCNWLWRDLGPTIHGPPIVRTQVLVHGGQI